MKQLVIFDLDGTLLNTIGDLAAASNHALRTLGFPTHADTAYRHFVGNGVSKLLERILPEDQRDPATIKKMKTLFTDFYDKHKTDHTHPYDGIKEMLATLTAAGIKVAVASNKYQRAASELVMHFFPETKWTAIEGQKEGIPTKPDPSVVFEILGKSPTPKPAVLYVGDSDVDMITAQRAGVESVGVEWGFRSVRELRDAYADHIVSIPSEITKIALSASPY